MPRILQVKLKPGQRVISCRQKGQILEVVVRESEVSEELLEKTPSKRRVRKKKSSS